MNMKLRENQEGFTLIELGIVVAVIAVLAVSVMVGQGFIQSSHMSKATQGIHMLKKSVVNYAGLQGGEMPDQAGALTELENLNYIRLDDGILSLAGNKFIVSDLELKEGSTSAPEQMIIQIEVPSGALSTLLHAALQKDPHYYTGGDDCTASFADDKTTVCFKDLV